MGSISCRSCGIIKEINFDNFPRHGNGFERQCRPCNRKAASNRSRKLGVCTDCKQTKLIYIKASICRTCGYLRKNKSGSKSNTWKGGHKHWQEGKLVRDKDGLSWKIQRKLCWERDNYTCQHCGLSKPNWKPDCHHVIPYRSSRSHALSNLLSLCRSCHKKADSSIS